MQTQFKLTAAELNAAITSHVQKTYGFKGVSVTGLEQAAEGGCTITGEVATKKPITRKSPAKKENVAVAAPVKK